MNAVGCRKLGSRGIGNWYSAQSERDWGSETAVQVLRSAKILHDPVIGEYLDRLVQRIVRNSDAQAPFTSYVIVSKEEENAFALPGGYLFLDSGLVLAAHNEAQLAAVIAHEIAHVAAHHLARQQTRAAGLGSLVPLQRFAYPAKLEEQADWLGAQYMDRAGYDPRQMIELLQQTKIRHGNMSAAQSQTSLTHPAMPERIAVLRKKIERDLPPNSGWIVDTPAFHTMQARLRHLTQAAVAPGL